MAKLKARPKKASKKTLDNKWAKLVKLRARNKCEFCMRDTHLNSHHIFSRSNLSTRWDEQNGVSLCAYHHALGTRSAHKSPIEFIEWLRRERGDNWYQKLRLRANTPQKPDMELINLYLTQMLEKYNDRDTNNL